MTSENLAAFARRTTTVEELEAAIGRPGAAIMLKQLDRLDEGCETILAHSPFAGCGYRTADGARHSTFAGGAPGFLHVRSPTQLCFALPATAPEPAIDHGISFVILLPGVGETLRLNGTVTATDGRETTVAVQEVYLHCGRCVFRSKLWQPRPVRASPPTSTAGDGPLAQPGIADFLARCPFLVLTTGDTAGGSDTSPRGDQPGFAQIVDGRTILLPDRNGNKRADTAHNLLQDPELALAALVPGRTEILQLRGTASLTNDPALLEPLALRGNLPQVALMIDVTHAELVHSEAIERSRLWRPEAHVDRAEVPDLMALAVKHASLSTAAGAPTGFLFKLLAKFPKLIRFGIDRGYRSQLHDEGYADSAPELDRSLRTVRVSEIRRETPQAVTIVLTDGDSFDFRPGQFFTLIADLDGRLVRRAYSASSRPGTKRLEVTVKRVANGRFSTYLHDHLRVGDRLRVRGPSGSFRPDPRADLVLIAAGSGITPMMSVLRTRLARPGRSRISLLYASRSSDETIFAAQLARLQQRHPRRLRITHVQSRPDADWAGERGRIDEDLLRRWLGDASPAAEYCVCGPAPVTAAARAVVGELGVPDGRFHEERYTSGAFDPAMSSAPREMVVENVGAATVEPGDTLLDAGLAAGLPMPYSCTVGNCGECLVRLRSGEVAMKQPNCLTPRQRADGYVLACVSCPRSDVVVEAEDG
ncbi:2Fe-2S iron-sulfur cluster-binding protein [Amycolatopsis dendrobii]|uniref:2Fe-2S iron-sulfur cluster binding domain-containing protein n=1 Tax=Amycolatopsis dendrobii TaxID=2760662 RepID=A0A7W3VWZ2_9PSEU|nr:2Fe-2S iron-sulfur cluster-binding protein [Amycolatopsis dendrobii]MBB1154746.1 2Fe-2S iron-sulfur cluster binding domain-containing protein [Amycolatopsis dendrobii]